MRPRDFHLVSRGLTVSLALAALASVASVASVAMGCSRKLSDGDCTKMIDKYVDMEIARDDEVAAAEERSRAALADVKKAQKKADSAYARARSQCVSEISKHEFDCAMRAETPEGWQACID